MTGMTPQAYPLQWPSGWPRTERQEKSRFQTSLPSALVALKREVNLLTGKGLVLSSNATLGDDWPRDKGVVAYFDLRGQPIAIPCDRWDKIEDNVKAIALTIEAMRGMERWGAKHMITAMFTGFKALPAETMRPWWIILGIPQDSTAGEINAAYKRKAMTCHPDKGGTEDEWHELQRAQDVALKAVEA